MFKVRAYRAVLKPEERTPDKLMVGWFFLANGGRAYIIRDEPRIGSPEWQQDNIEDLGWRIVEIDIETAALEA